MCFSDWISVSRGVLDHRPVSILRWCDDNLSLLVAILLGSGIIRFWSDSMYIWVDIYPKEKCVFLQFYELFLPQQYFE